MGFTSIAVGIGKKAISSGKAAANSGSGQSSEAPEAEGNTAFDKISKWNQNRKAQKNMGLNDLSGVTAKLDTGEVEAKKGGKVKSEGLIKVHEGERILTKAQTKKYDEGPKPAKKAAPKKKTASKAGPRKRS